MRNTLFIGGGNMAYAILGGLLSNSHPAGRFYVLEINPSAQENIRSLGVQCSSEWPSDFKAEQIVLAVKPQAMQEALTTHQARLAGSLLISIAAGVTVDQLQAWSKNQRIARAMPNTPALVGKGMTGIFLTDPCTPEDQTDVEALFSSCGQVHPLQSETEINQMTAIAGSGPGYVFYLMEGLEHAALELGFAPEQARLLVNQTFLGASTLASKSTESLAMLREKVTSKGGTTFAGIEVLRAKQVGRAIEQAAQAAQKRAEDMQKGN